MTCTRPVIIIGGGLGGLSLAQGLKSLKPPVPFVIYERDDAADFRAQGYRIRINQDGGNSLRKLLTRDLFQAFEDTSSPVIKGGQTYDAITGQVPPPPPGGRGPPPQIGETWNVDRTVLRALLLTGLKPHEIQFGKKFSHFEVEVEGKNEPSRSVVAYFADGSSARGSFLIGADGVRSSVRCQLVPGYRLLDTEGRAIFGKTPIVSAAPLPTGIRTTITNGITLIKDTTMTKPRSPHDAVVETVPMVLFCDAMHFDHTRSLPAPKAADTLSSPRVVVDLPSDYIYWVLVFRKDRVEISDEGLARLAHAEAGALAETLTAHWESSARAIIAHRDPEACSSLHFAMSPPVAERMRWADRTQEGKVAAGTSNAATWPVTLLGDAAHAKVPVGGVGANSAFQDAADLCSLLGQVYHGSDGVADDSRGRPAALLSRLLHEYETKCVERAAEAMQAVVGGGARAFFGMRPWETLPTLPVRA